MWDVNKAQGGEQPWYGWAMAAPQACVKEIDPQASTSPPPGIENPDLFGPVAFSFLTNSSFASFAFCYANIEEHTVTATFDIVENRITEVSDEGLVQKLGLAPNGYAPIFLP